MSKQYELVAHKTYVIGSRLFKAGEKYSAEQVGDLADATTEDDEPLFAEVEGEAKAVRKSIVVGKKASAPAPDGGDGKGGDETITV